MRTWTETPYDTFQSSGTRAPTWAAGRATTGGRRLTWLATPGGQAHVFRYQGAWRYEEGDSWSCGAGLFWEHSERTIWVSENPASSPVEVFDAAGRVVRRLTDDRGGARAGSVVWDGRNAGGEVVPGGTYFARVGPKGRAAAIVLIR